MNNINIKVYGADWCPATRRTLEHLRRMGVSHEFIDVERDRRASEWVKQQNNGKEIKPTVEIAGHVLSEPTNDELDSALQANGA